MNLKNSIVRGTIILTFAGILSRIIGFFYRIFLSRYFGEEAMGIYQLINPLMMLSYALCISGIQSAISKQIAEKSSKKVLYIGMLLSLLLSSICSILIFHNASFLAANVFFEKRLTSCIKILVLSLPLSSIHSCIDGYFYGKKKAKFPAILQLLEQLGRVLSVVILVAIYHANNSTAPLSVVVLGIFIGEIFSSFFSLFFLSFEKKHETLQKEHHPVTLLLDILKYSIPLSTTRIVVGILQSIESIYIPQNLLLAGYSTEDALSLFGVLTGMALPFILFPTALTNSLSSLLLPTVSSDNVNKNFVHLQSMLKKTLSFCIGLGFLCFIFFFTLGKLLGKLLFHSTMAGTFIMSLSFICPFLYTNTSLNAIINGLGKTIFTFIVNIISIFIRLFFIFILIKRYGILAYLWGMLLSQLFSFFASFLYINQKFHLFSLTQKHQ